MSTLKVDTIKSDTTSTVTISDGLSVTGSSSLTGDVTTANLNLTGEVNFTGNGHKYIDVATLNGGHSLSIRHQDGGSYETGLTLDANGAAKLFHNNFKSFQTDSNGIVVYGPEGDAVNINVYADEGDDDADKFRVRADQNGIFTIQNYASGSWETNIECNGNGNVELYHNNTIMGETTSSGIKVPIATAGHGITIDAGSNNIYPQLTFNANRSAENNSVGYIRAQWNTTDIAAIDFVAGPDTTNKDDGHIRFNTRLSGSGISERMRIASNGKIGINCTSPTVALDIRGTADGGNTGIKIIAEADTYAQLTLDGNRTSAANAVGIIAGRWNNNDVCSIYLTAGSDTTNKDDGQIHFYTTPGGGASPSRRLKFTESGVWYGSLYDTNTNAGLSANIFVFSNDSMGRASSSGKYKKNIETIQDSYADKILTMRPTWYQQDETTVNIQEDQGDNWGYWGFIAEEVAAIDPRLVTWKVANYTTDPSDQTKTIRTPLSEPEPDNVAYDRFVPHLVNLLKRQSVEIENLKTKVAALESA